MMHKPQAGGVCMRRKIFLIGKQGDGKSQASNILQDLAQDAGLRVQVDAFGNYLKALTDREFNLASDVPKHVKRPYYQAVGRVARLIDPYYLIRQLESNVRDDMDDPNTVTIVEDGRTLSEWAWARKNGFLTIRIQTSDDIRIERLRLRDGGFDESTLHDPVTEDEVDLIIPDVVVKNVTIGQLIRGLQNAVLKK